MLLCGERACGVLQVSNGGKPVITKALAAVLSSFGLDFIE